MNIRLQTLLRQTLLTLMLLIFSGCSSSDNVNLTSPTSYQTFTGRDQGNPSERVLVYRAKVPTDWVRKDPASTDSILDSTKALCEFWIIDVSLDKSHDDRNGDDKIRIAIHNFPTQKIEQRTPPLAQIARWKRQFASLDSIDTKITAQAFSGYSGMLFEGTGIINSKQTTVLAWSMQLAPEHYRNINPEDKLLGTQMRADFTIKASGPTSLMLKYKTAIIAFANSFELIQDIPARS